MNNDEHLDPEISGAEDAISSGNASALVPAHHKVCTPVGRSSRALAPVLRRGGRPDPDTVSFEMDEIARRMRRGETPSEICKGMGVSRKVYRARLRRLWRETLSGDEVISRTVYSILGDIKRCEETIEAGERGEILPYTADEIEEFEAEGLDVDALPERRGLPSRRQVLQGIALKNKLLGDLQGLAKDLGTLDGKKRGDDGAIDLGKLLNDRSDDDLPTGNLFNPDGTVKADADPEYLRRSGVKRVGHGSGTDPKGSGSDATNVEA